MTTKSIRAKVNKCQPNRLLPKGSKQPARSADSPKAKRRDLGRSISAPSKPGSKAPESHKALPFALSSRSSKTPASSARRGAVALTVYVSKKYAKQLEMLAYVFCEEDRGKIIEAVSFLPNPSDSQFTEILEDLTWNSKRECEEVAARVGPKLDHPHFIHIEKEGRKWKLVLNDKRWPHWNELYVQCRELGLDYQSAVEKIRDKVPLSLFPEAVQEFIAQTSKEGAR